MAELMLQNRKIAPPYLLQRFGVSVAEFEEITDEDIKAELMDGVMIMHSPATLRHDDLMGFLLFLLRGYAESRQLGKVLGPNAIMHLGERRRFAPDLMFIRQERLRLPWAKEFQGAADWVIEILSEHTRSYDLREKRAIYQEVGITEIWMIDGEQHRVIADRRRGGGYEERIISTGRVSAEALPGFWLDAEWLWPERLPNPLTSLEQILRNEA